MSYNVYWRGGNQRWYYASHSLTQETAEDLAEHVFRSFGCERAVAVQHAEGETASSVDVLPGETVFKLERTEE